MGQYHLTVNLDKRQFLDPHKLGDGLKLWEQVNSEGGTCAALFMLLTVSNGRGGGDLHTFVPGPDKTNPYRDGHYIEPEIVGSWGGDRIAVVGDYAEDTDLHPEHMAGLVYTLCRMSQALRDGTADEFREHWDDPQYGQGAKYDMAFEEGLAMARTWRDISDDMVPLLEEFCGVKFTSKDGWRSKVRAGAA